MDMSHRWHFYPVVHGIMSILHMGLSLVFVIAPGQRFSSPSWGPLRDLSGGSLWPWGVALGVAGILMLHGTLWSDMIGEAVAIFWFSFLAALFLVAMRDPSASATGFVVYSGLMAVNGALLAQRVLDWMAIRRYERSGG